MLEELYVLLSLFVSAHQCPILTIDALQLLLHAYIEEELFGLAANSASIIASNPIQIIFPQHF